MCSKRPMVKRSGSQEFKDNKINCKKKTIMKCKKKQKNNNLKMQML